MSVRVPTPPRPRRGTHVAPPAPSPDAPAPARRTHLAWWLGIGVLACVAVLAFLLGRPAPVSCDYRADGDRLQDQMTRGNYSTVTNLADGLLDSVDPRCTTVATQIALLRYRATIEVAFQLAHSAPGGSQADHQALQTYREAVHFADQHNLSAADRSPAALAVAQRAYEAGAWEFSQGALQDAWQQRAFSRSDFDKLNLYYSTLVNLGVARAASNSSEQGLELLCDADTLARSTNLPRAEAQQELRRWFAASTCDPQASHDLVVRSLVG